MELHLEWALGTGVHFYQSLIFVVSFKDVGLEKEHHKLESVDVARAERG